MYPNMAHGVTLGEIRTDGEVGDSWQERVCTFAHPLLQQSMEAPKATALRCTRERQNPLEHESHCGPCALILIKLTVKYLISGFQHA